MLKLTCRLVGITKNSRRKCLKIHEKIVKHPKSMIFTAINPSMFFEAFTSRIEGIADLESFFPDYPEMKILESIESTLSPENLRIQAGISRSA